jgi:hypothetical protein
MTDKQIRQIWHEIEYAEPDISTERLLAMVIDQIKMESGEELDYGDVIEAIERLYKSELGEN